MMTTIKVLVPYPLTLFSHPADSPVLQQLVAFLTIVVSSALSFSLPSGNYRNPLTEWLICTIFPLQEEMTKIRRQVVG